MEANAGDSLRDQVVLITGGSRGIGKALAKAFTLAGAQVVLTARSQIDLDRVATAIRQQGGHCLGQAADVSRASDVQALVNAAVGRFGRIDTLINNAGVFHDNRPLYQLDEASWDQVMDVNLKGSFLCCKYVIPHMRPNHSGCIINLSSDLGRETPRWGAYGISKVGHRWTDDSDGQRTAVRPYTGPFGQPRRGGDRNDQLRRTQPGRRHVALFVSQLGSRSANHGQAASRGKMGEAIGAGSEPIEDHPSGLEKTVAPASCRWIDPPRKAGPGYG